MNIKNIFQKSDPKMDEQKLIAEIHNEFDTAEDRLIQQANDILSKLKVDPQLELEKKAERLKKIGFFNTPIAKKAEEIIKERKEIEEKIVKTKSEAELIQYYKFNYPFLKFLTEPELDRICKKHNLIYAPVDAFIKDVPDKNITDIENAKPLDSKDELVKYSTVKITEFWKDVPDEIRDIFKQEIRYNGFVNREGRPSESELLYMIKEMGYSGGYTGWIFKEAIVKTVDKSGLFICAPLDHFDLTKLSKESELGFYKVQKIIINDPIVFRYCRGGLQVISKWGLEANDEALINEINN